MGNRTIFEKLEQWGPDYTLQPKHALGPNVASSGTMLDNDITNVLQITLEDLRRYDITARIVATGLDTTEYYQLIYISAATDGYVTFKDFEVIRTKLNNEIVEDVNFPFTIAINNTDFVLEVQAENTSGQTVNWAAMAQLESWVQPLPPE